MQKARRGKVTINNSEGVSTTADASELFIDLGNGELLNIVVRVVT
jgi:hypothetical protein